MKIKELIDFNSAFYPKWNSDRAEDYLKRLSLNKKQTIKSLSRGMKLKLGLLIALVAEPELLILDDPTSGLDVHTRHDFLKDIIREILESGTTILFASHIVHELEGIIDHLSILNDGRLILNGDFQSIKDSIRKVRIRFENNQNGPIDIDGKILDRLHGHEREMVVYPWTSEAEMTLRGLKPSLLEIHPLSLEEIFISFVS